MPPPFDDEPLVVEPEVLPAGLAGVADEPVLLEVPSTATEFPPAATGAATEVVAWLPPRVLFAPVVPDCAEACPAMNRIPPPTNRAVSRPLRRYAFMVVPFLTYVMCPPHGGCRSGRLGRPRRTSVRSLVGANHS